MQRQSLDNLHFMQRTAERNPESSFRFRSIFGDGTNFPDWKELEFLVLDTETWQLDVYTILQDANQEATGECYLAYSVTGEERVADALKKYGLGTDLRKEWERRQEQTGEASK